MSRTCGKGVTPLILNALCALYDRLTQDAEADVPQQGFAAAKAGVALELSADGDLVRAVPLGTQKGKRTVPLRLTVPDRVKRTSGLAANFLCDNAEYCLGLSVDESGAVASEAARRRHELSVDLHEAVLSEIDDPGAAAVLAFFRRWHPEAHVNDEKLRAVSRLLAEGRNIVFRLAGDGCYVHERPAVKRAWEGFSMREDANPLIGQCLVTGEQGPVARLHKSIYGIAGAGSTGVTLVSFNFRAAESYGKSQGENSPVSERAAFAYGTALNWLTANERHRLLMGDTTVVFWAERTGPEENLLLDLFADAVAPYGKNEARDVGADGPRHDEAGAARVRSILERVVRGLDVTDEMTDFDSDVRFFILGLAPNAARVVVRFWHVDTFGTLLERVRRHFNDMALVGREGARPVSVGQILLETAPAVEREQAKIPGRLIGPLMRAILDGSMYPQSLYAAMIARIRSDFNDPEHPRFERKVTHVRAAYIKAHLKRKARITGDKAMEEVLTEMLNLENKNKGYLLGRLFALLEKAQQDANPGINATIKDRYYASASATPGAVFPVLLRLAQHHIAKSEYGGYVDRLIQDVVCDLDSFPMHLDLVDQGLFALGYYQQKDALYRKSE